MIKKRKLGKTDILVSEIGLGTYQLGGSSKINDIPIAFGNMDNETANNIINSAFKFGVNTFDTADFYSLGKSEVRLGNAVKKYRNEINLLVEGSRVRMAADIFKLVGLGADAVGISKAALLSINYDPKKFRNDSNESNFDQDKTREKLEYTILAMQKEIKLLAGAAGISSIQNSLLGNRELFRTVDLDPLIRKRLGIKAGGAP